MDNPFTKCASHKLMGSKIFYILAHHGPVSLQPEDDHVPMSVVHVGNVSKGGRPLPHILEK